MVHHWTNGQVQGVARHNGGTSRDATNSGIGRYEIAEQMGRRSIESKDLRFLSIQFQLVQELGSTRHVCDPSTNRMKSKQLATRGWYTFAIRRQVDHDWGTRSRHPGTSREAPDVIPNVRAGKTDLVAIGLYTYLVNSSGRSLNGTPCRYLRTTDPRNQTWSGDCVLTRANSKSRGHRQRPEEPWQGPRFQTASRCSEHRRHNVSG